MNGGIMTIDDIPSKNTPAMVDYLKEKGICAMLFATGQNIGRYYQEAVYAVKSGMIVGNHSYSHPAFSALSLDACKEEIEKCEAILDQLYRDAGVIRKYRPFRFPYGDKGGKNKAALQQYLRERQFDKVDDAFIPYPWWRENQLDTDIDHLWTFDFEEYRIRPGSDFTEKSVWEKMQDENPSQGAALLGENHRHILLMHAHDETEEMLPGYYRIFLDALMTKGFIFDTPRFIGKA